MSVNSQQPKSSNRSQIKLENSINPSSSQSKRGTFPAKANYPRGQKRRFGSAGIINVLLTNLVLQILLTTNIVGVTTATLISQLVNTCLGYTIYGKIVFNAERLRHHRPLLRYLSLMTVMWLVNAACIAGGEAFGINKNLTAAGLIPCLAMLSFVSQKYWVFR